MYRSLCSIAFYLFCIPILGFSQLKPPASVGEVKGVIRDSLLNYNLPSATVAIYRMKNLELLSYRLSNNLGEFHFESIPTGIPLTLVISFVGYHNISKNFEIDETKKKIDFKNLIIHKRTDTLEDVEVRSVAPVRINGDTLEFNADAFQLTKNAVTEDLLRKLPGVIVWGDGTITVNGKEIRSLLVNGKPFFGGDAKVSTQNIPKDAIEKIQVYQVERDINKPRDTLTEINLQLKKAKNRGYFGKIELGYGVDNKYDAGGNINIFSPRTQVALVGMTNNVNKIAKDINTILVNNTFKGGGANLSYQPNFQIPGLTSSNIGGFTFQTELDSAIKNVEKNLLSSSYIVKNIQNILNSTVLSETAVGANLSQTSKSILDSDVGGTEQNFESNYERSKGNFEYKASLSTVAKMLTGSKNQADTVSNNVIGIQSFRNLINASKVNSKNINFRNILKHLKSIEDNSPMPANWNVDYLIDYTKTNENNYNETIFSSALSQSENRNFNRVNNREEALVKQVIDVKLSDLGPLIFGRNRLDFRGIGVEIENLFSLTHKKITNDVSSLTSGIATKNEELTYAQLTNVIDEQPGINFSKSFASILANRFQKNWLLSLSVRGQVYSLKNTSARSSQNFDRTYGKFIPSLSATYSNYQSGEFLEKWELKFESSYVYPTEDQLYPVVDNSVIYYVQIGNQYLRPGNKRELSLNFNHNSLARKNTFLYSAKLNVGYMKDYLANSTIFYQDGHSTFSLFNTDGYKFLNVSAILNKAIKLKENSIQFKVKTNLDLSIVPGYTQNYDQSTTQLYISNILKSGFSLEGFYSFRDIFAITLLEEVNNYLSKQKSVKQSSLQNALHSTLCALNTNLSRRFSFGTNISVNTNSSTSVGKTQFVLWNANTSFRFLSGNNLEVKLSALDLLNQNQNIINYGDINIVRQTQSSVLRQYFMLGVSYFPRRFGTKKKSNY